MISDLEQISWKLTKNREKYKLFDGFIRKRTFVERGRDMNESDVINDASGLRMYAERMTECDDSIRESINAIKSAVRGSVSASPKLVRAGSEYEAASCMDILYRRTADNDNAVLNAEF